MSADPRFPDSTPTADPAGSSLPPTLPFHPGTNDTDAAGPPTFVPARPAGAPRAAPVLPVAAAPADEPGSDRLDHYEILRREDGRRWELGHGAMGTTFKALDTRLRVHVALKLINPNLLDRRPALRERFLREARAAARLRHPNVAGVFHLNEGEGDAPCFYAMEFIAGETLESRVRRAGPLPLPLVLEVVAQVTRALVAASAQGLVHRDLKPANLMLVAGAEPDPERAGVLVKVIDFGLAKAITDNADLTGLHGFIGTPQFASPEQVSGAAAEHAPDVRTDIYSLGVTLWYALTGKVPFPGRNLAEIHDRQRRPPPLDHLEAVNVPEPVRELLASMLAPNPVDRPPTPYALAEALRACRASLLPATDATAGPPRATSVLDLPLHARRRRRRRWVLGGLAAVGGLLELAWLLGFVRHPADRGGGPAVGLNPAVVTPERSVAVLPFENLSPEPDNAFLADGLQDDVLTSLAKIRELKVISRSSVLPYREVSKRGNLRDIGRALDVAHFVEGTVRRAGHRVLVNVQLIDAGSGRQLWAQNYDRTLTDSLTLQGELATEIAGALRATLSPEERARVERRPTENPDAYVLFLRAREYQIRPDILLANLQAAEQLYGQAVALDPGFALAHARLSQTRSRIAFNYQPTAALQARARAAAETALRLQPDLGEGHLAMGFCRYWADRDYDGALAEFAVATRALPNEAEILRAVGYVHRRQGRWAEALASFERAAVLGPRDPAALEALAKFYLDRRDWPAAAGAYDRAAALVPESVDKKLSRARVELLWRGDLGPLTVLLATVPPDVDPEGQVTFARYDVALLRRDYAEARRVLETSPRETLPLGVGTPLHRGFMEGMIFRARGGPGDGERARAGFESARAHYEGEARGYPRDALRHSDLGLLYAALGWRDAALGEAFYAGQLRPEARDAVNGATVALRLARTYALLGDATGAVPLLEHLLTVPVDEWTGFSVHDLRLRPDWDAVRGDPGFQRLLAAGGGST